MTFHDFAAKTSIHGFSWISSSPNKKIKIYWFLILLGMIAFLLYNVFENVQLYLSHPTDTEIIQVNDPVNFPQLAICPDHPIPFFKNVEKKNLEIYQEYFYFYHNIIVELEEVCKEERNKNFIIGENFNCIHRDLDLDINSASTVTTLQNYEKLYEGLYDRLHSIISQHIERYGDDFLEFSLILLALSQIEKGKLEEDSYCALYMKYSSYSEIIEDAMTNTKPVTYVEIDLLMRQFGEDCDYDFFKLIVNYPKFFDDPEILKCEKKKYLTNCLYYIFYSEVMDTFRHDFKQDILIEKENLLREETFEQTWDRFKKIGNLQGKFSSLLEAISRANFSPIPNFTILKIIYIHLRRLTFLQYKKKEIITKIKSTNFNLQEYFETYENYLLDHIVTCIYRQRSCKSEELSVKLSEKGPCIIFSADDIWSYRNSLEMLIDLRSPSTLGSTSIHGSVSSGGFTLKLSPGNDSIIFSPLQLELSSAYSTTILLKGKQMVLESRYNKDCESSEDADDLYICYEKCFIKYIDAKCDCYPFFARKEPTCTLPEQINCYYTLQKYFDVNEQCGSCKLKCKHFYYRTPLQNSQLLLSSREKQILNKRRFQCRERKKNSTDERCSLEGIDIQSLARINIKFKDSFYIRFFHNTIIDIYTTFSNVGGTMGLCIGMSLISLVEIMDYIGTFLMNRAKKKKLIIPFETK